MFGAILGDIIGQPYEFDRGHKTKEFPLFSKHPHFTDSIADCNCHYAVICKMRML